MKHIDKKRLLAMDEIKVYARSILILADSYASWYKDEECNPQTKMDVLAEQWRVITQSNICLTEILRENGL